MRGDSHIFSSMCVHPSDIPRDALKSHASTGTQVCPIRACLQPDLKSQSSNLHFSQCSNIFLSEKLTRFENFYRSTKNDMARTYESQSSLHSAVNHALGSSKGNWLIPALHVVSRNTHKVAALADEYVNRSTGNRNDHARLQNAVTLLQASYSKTLNDRVELRVSGNVGYGLSAASFVNFTFFCHLYCKQNLRFVIMSPHINKAK